MFSAIKSRMGSIGAFKLRRDWNDILKRPDIFHVLKDNNSFEKRQLDKMVLAVVYDRGFDFMT